MRGLRVAAAGLAVLALAACTDPETPDPSASGSGPSAEASGSQSPEPTTAEKLTSQLLQRPEAPTPVTTLRGSLTRPDGPVAVEVDILAVQASAETTLLRWRLRSGTGQPQQVLTSSLSRPNLFDTRAVALLDAVGNQRVQPFTYIPTLKTADLRCVCSEVPRTVSAVGVQMYALFPPLAADASTVDVVIPGLPIAEKVPVTR